MAGRKKVKYLFLQVNNLLTPPLSSSLSVMVTIDPHVDPGSTAVGAEVGAAAPAVSPPPAPPVATAGGGRDLDRNGATEDLAKPVEREERDQIKKKIDQRRTLIREREARNRDVKIMMVSYNISWFLVNVSLLMSTEKGFCMLGDQCPFDHGVDPVVIGNNIPHTYPPPPSMVGIPSLPLTKPS